MLDSKGNKIFNLGTDSMRGNKPYDPPIGWIGIGLKVIGKYDYGDNSWIGNTNNQDEWCVAFHGVYGHRSPYEEPQSRTMSNFPK